MAVTRRIGLTLSYAYHLKLNETMKLSLGLTGGLLQFSVDGSKITTHDQNDLAMSSGMQSVIVPDFGFGAMLHTDKYYVGASIPQLYQSQLKFFDYTTSTLSKLATHYFVMGGYKYDVNDDIRLEPSMLIKYVSPAPLKVDIGFRAIYKKMAWAGVSYRTNDAIAFLIGYTYQNYLTFAYSYDYTTTDLRNYSTGTHEIMFGLRFNNKPKK
jgi:type IX secretion system PorP/SprF family membrane protein